MVSQALGRMTGAASLAATLRDLLAAESEGIRLGSARPIFDLSAKLRESVELQTRIVDLEQQLNDESRQGSRLPRHKF